MSATDNGNIGTLVRSRLWFDDGFTQVPNTWTRDARLSWSARGVLVWMVGHSAGFEITILGIAAAGPQGVDAVRRCVGELERAGYLKRYRRREKGRITGTVWHLQDPHAPVDNQGVALSGLEPVRLGEQKKAWSEPRGGFPRVANPSVANPDVEKPTTKEDHLEEDLKEVPEEPAIDVRAQRALGRCPRTRAGKAHLLDENGYCIACLTDPATGRTI